MRCSVTGPDSIFFDKKEYNRYIPGTFVINVTLANTGSGAVDSVVVFPRSNPRFIVAPPAAKLVAASLKPGDSVSTDFTLTVQPRSSSGFDTIIVAVSAKAGNRTECLLPVWVEKEYKPVNVIVCLPGPLSVVFVDSLNDYDPNPLAVPVTVINQGDAPSKETRIFYVATSGITPAENQDPIIDVGVIPAGGRVDRAFLLRLVRRTSDTTVDLHFKVQGKGGLGDRIIDTLCSVPVIIPASREVTFALECSNGIQLEFKDGKYVPDPFLWTASVRNTGVALAKNVRVAIALPTSLYLDSLQTTEAFVGDMPPGMETRVSWLLRPRFSDSGDTAAVCVRAFDAFNRAALCCDTIHIPPVKAPLLQAQCEVVPDSIFIDLQTGKFLPDEFTARVLVGNSGSEAVDSVRVELIIGDPDVRLVSPVSVTQLLVQRLEPLASGSVAWILAPLPNPVARSVLLQFRVQGLKVRDIVTSCEVFLDATLSPALQCFAATIPEDTVHFDKETVQYEDLLLTASVRNVGPIAARNVQATILLPSTITLANGEPAVKSHPVGVLPPDSLWTPAWKLTPLHQRDGVLDTIRVEFRADGIRSMCDDRIFIVGIPPVTVLSIPGNMVERYGKKVRVPVQIDNTDEKDIHTLDIRIAYDDTKVDFLGFDRSDVLLGAGWLWSNQSRPGMIGFHATSDSLRLKGEGTLVFMEFEVTFGLGLDALNIAGTPLAFDTLASSLNRGGILTRFLDGAIMVSGDCLWPLVASDRYVILQNRPNPFNPSTTLSYSLAESRYVRLTIVDGLGRTVAVLVNEEQNAGDHVVRFIPHGRQSSGVYYALLEVEGRTAIRPMHFLK